MVASHSNRLPEYHVVYSRIDRRLRKNLLLLEAATVAKISAGTQLKRGVVKRDPDKVQAVEELRQRVQKNLGEARKARS